MVPKQDIVDKNLRYSKEIEYVAVEYPPTSEIMADIRKKVEIDKKWMN